MEMSTMNDTTATTAKLQARAIRLRKQASIMSQLLARTYLRRAAELDVQALLEAVWNPPMDLTLTLDPRAA
jgi:hypothetical protein